MKNISVALIALIILVLFNSSNCFIFSVIMAIYNTGKYLDDSIGSLYNQTINFKKIQVILVNDGSTDNSEEICLKYKEKYNKNIIYIKIEHSGVSKARNIGLKFAKGKYINFLDADDIWGFQSFKYVSIFFKFNKNVDIVAGRLKFFEAINTYHPLDYKFYKTRVVNLTEDYNYIQMSGPSTFFRSSIIKNEKFPEKVFSGEDKILLLKPIIGFIKEAIYYYRRRSDSSSAVQNQVQKVEFYFSQLKYVGQYLLEKSKELYNKVMPFIQFYIGYNNLFRILSPAYKYLNHDDFIEYCNLIEDQLKQIDDKYILEQRFTPYRTKLLAISKKYKTDVRYDVIIKNDLLLYSGKILINITKSSNIIIWRILDIKQNILKLEGKDNFWMPKDKYFYYCKIGNKTLFPNYYDYPGFDFYTMYGLVDKGRMITFNIPIEENNETLIKFFISYNGENIEIFPSFGKFARIPTIKNGYYSNGNYIIKLIQKRLIIFKYNQSLEEYFEKEYCKILKSIHKDDILQLRKKYFNNRDLYFIDNKKEIWLINDNKAKAGDNGEYFFRYLMNKKLSDISIFFVIKKECDDYERLKKFGNILDLDSTFYLDIFLNSDKIISSISDEWVTNPFGEEKIYIGDLFHFDSIFIENGIIVDDLSKILDRINKNFSLFITSSKKEYNTILSSGYYYNKDNVVLTGLSKYDNLIEISRITHKEKLILIIPTWRLYITGTRDLVTFESIYSPHFKNTTFFDFYNNFINDQKILYYMEKYHFFGLFCLHPYFSEQIIDFTANNFIAIKTNCNYQELLPKASLLVTDYSNIFFDFAYLKKPIIYSHFDINEYRKYQYPEGYFDYFKDGFGPVCYNIECLENELIELLINNCKQKKKYINRIKKFFSFSDNNNNERIYSEIIKNLKNDNENPFQSQIFINILFIIFFLFKFRFLLKH